ncbi:hypothetical protein Tco_0468119 [Tanacetum coccineum]
MSSSTVTYTSISFDSNLPPWGFHLLSDAEPQSPKDAPQPPEKAPPSPNYVPGPEYPEYVALFDDEIPVEDQPLPADASPTTLLSGYVADSDLEEDPEEDPADYPVDGADDEEEEESSEDDDEEEEETSEEEEEHLALADSAAATLPPPRSPQTRVPFSQTRLRRARKTVRPRPPMAASTEALIVEYASVPTPPSPPPSPLSPLSSPLPRIPSLPKHTSPTYSSALLGYRVAMVQSDIPETDMPFWKRLCLTAPAFRVDYGFIDTMDTSIRSSESRVMTTMEEVNERVTDLATTQRQDAHEFYVHDEDAQGDRALLRAQISLLVRERRYFCSIASSYEREAVYARHAWSRSEDRSTALEALIRKQRIDDDDRLTSHIQHKHDRFRELACTRDVGHQDGAADAGSSC